MADRADYLARTMMGRLANLRAAFTEDGRGEPDRRQRMEAIEKVLAVELGITDGMTIAVIEAAVPEIKTSRGRSDRELTEFAEFLRRRLASELAES
jgi:hypothetical protein